MTDWKKEPAIDLEAAIARFKADLPGWWYTLGECEKSCDASCGPTRESHHCHPDYFAFDRRFDDGFDADLDQPSTLAIALDTVRNDALLAIEAYEA